MSKGGKFNVINFSDAKSGIKKNAEENRNDEIASGFFVDNSMSIFVQILRDIVLDTTEANISCPDSRNMALVLLIHSLKNVEF